MAELASCEDGEDQQPDHGSEWLGFVLNLVVPPLVLLLLLLALLAPRELGPELAPE